MDRYEFNLKSQQMRKLAADGRYEEAALIADEIDWNRVKNTRLLMLTADIYEATKQPEKEFDVLDIAYERSPMGKQLAYRLALVASELGEYEEAENYYKDYVDMAPNDSRRFLLRYRLSKARGEDLDLQIGLLERYLDGDMEERWSYELCELYARAGYQDKCVNLCDELITWFGEGKYVFAALKLKKKYAPLSVSQQQKYDAMKQEAQPKQTDEEEPVSAEIARTRNEVLRGRTLSEKMQAVAEKRIQDDAGEGEGGETPSKNTEPVAAKNIATGTVAVKNAGTGTVAAKNAGNSTVAAKAAEAEPAGKMAAPEVMHTESAAAGNTGGVDGRTRRYDGKAVRRAESAAKNADKVDDIFDLHEKEDEAVKAETAEAEEDKTESDPEFDIDDIHIKTYSDRAYDTMNIQAELAKSMEAILRTDEARGTEKAARRSGSGGTGPAVRTYVPPTTGAASEEDPFGYEQGRKEPEKQITGQMSIEEILKDLQTRGILKEDTVESALRVTGQLPLWKVQNTEESVVKEMEEVSLRDYTTGEIDLEIVQNEVDERQKARDREAAEESAEPDFTEIAEAAAEPENAEESVEPDFTGITEAAAEPETGKADAEPDFTGITEAAAEPEAVEKTAEPDFTEITEAAAEPETAEESAEPDFTGITEATAEPEAVEKSAEPDFTGITEAVAEPEAVEKTAEPDFTEITEAAAEPETAEESAEPDFTGIIESAAEPESGKADAEPDFTGITEAAAEPETTEESAEPDFTGITEETAEPETAEESAEPDFTGITKAAAEAEAAEETAEPDFMEIAEEAAEAENSEEDVELSADDAENPDEEDEKEPENDEEESESTGEQSFDTTDFLNGLEQDLSRLGQDGNPYTQMRNEDVKRETEKMDDVFAVIREMETDLSEEDRIYNAYTEEEPKEKRFLDETDRQEFGPYLKITGMESQIAKAIEDYVKAYNNDGTSNNPNILITGGAKTGKSQLAVSLIRSLNRHLGREGRKTARISGFNLNRKTLSASMPRLLGNDLLIEHAGEINKNIVAELMDILPKYTGGMIVVMEDEKARLDHLFEDYPLLADYFPNHLDIKEYDINEWAAVAKSYARSQGYTIDELGTLALYAEIDSLYGMLQGLEVDDIKDIIDDAIEHSERKMGAAFARIFGKKKEKGRKVLHETDFDA